MRSFTLKKRSFSIVFIFFIGLFVHLFVIRGPTGFNIRPYFFTIFLALLFRLSSVRVKHLQYFLLLLPIFLYWGFQIIYFAIIDSNNLSEHFITMIIILIFITILLIIFGDYNYTQKTAKYIYKSIFIIFTIEIILYFLLIRINGIEKLRAWSNSGYDKMEYLNTLKNMIFIDRGYLPRNSGFHLSPNFWAGFCMFAIYILLYARQLSDQKDKWYNAAVFVSIISLFLTFSRGTFFALILGIIFYNFNEMLNVFVKVRLNLFVKTIVLIVILFIVVIFFFDINLDKLSAIISSKLKIEYLLKDARFRIWKCHIQSFYDHPILGEGLQRSKEVYVPTINPPRFSASHNVIVNMLNYMGIIGTTIFGIITLCILTILICKSRLYKNYKIYKLGMSMLISLFVYTLFEHAFVTLFYWGIIIISISIVSFTPLNRQKQ